MSFDQLPNEILIIIFGKIPLQKQIQLRAVTKRWYVVIEDMCQHRRSLKLFDSLYGVTNYCSRLSKFAPDELDYWRLKPAGHNDDDDLIIDARYFTLATFELLGRLFPTIEKLIVFKIDAIGTSNYFEKLHLLLDIYRNCLVSLSIGGRYYYVYEHTIQLAKVDQERQLVKVEELQAVLVTLRNYKYDFYPTITTDLIADAINSMPNLTRLNLFADNLIHRIVPALHRNTLERLECFSAYDRDHLLDDTHRGERKSIANHFGSLGSRCTRLESHLLDLVLGDGWDNRSMVCSNLRATLTHLHTAVYMGPGSLFPIVCAQLSELQYLSLEFFHVARLNQPLLLELNRLKKLNELHLHGLTYSRTAFAPPDAEHLTLKSVERLSLELVDCYELEQEPPWRRLETLDGAYLCAILAAWFPALHHLTIICDAVFLESLYENVRLLPQLVSHRFVSVNARDRQLERYAGRHRIHIT